MDIGFIHIGMTKTATTYMQNIWLRDESYCLSHQGNIPFLLELRDCTKKSLFLNSPAKQIQLDMPYRQGQKIVISNEGFSTAFINEENYQDKIPEFIDFTSKSLSDLSKTTQNVLIVVREPIAWMRSVFVQSIKQGGKGTFQDFINQQNLFIRHSFDLEGIVMKYGRYFNNILVLPYELFREDENAFWDVISNEFGVPMISTKISDQINTSLSEEKTYLLSELNGIANFLIETVDNASSYKNINEKKQLVSRFQNDSKWVFRRFMEHASEESISGLKEILNGLEFSADYFDVDIPEELLAHIDDKYIQFLKGKIDNTILETYQKL